MTRFSQLETAAPRRSLVRLVFLAALLIVATAITPRANAQDASLGEVARQTHSDKQTSQNQAAGKAQALVDEMVQQQEASENAPTGFRSYDAGDYRLFVPYPFELVGRENGGAVLAGSQLGVTNTEVMAGTPIPVQANLSDRDLAKLASEYARQYAQSAGCVAAKVGERRAFHCGMNQGSLLGHKVWGTMMFVVGSSSMIPVVCVSPNEMNEAQVYGNPRATWQQKQAAYAHQDRRFRDERTTAQVCDQIIYPSIQLKEDVVVHPATIGSKLQPAAAVTNRPAAPVPQPAVVAAPAQDGSASPSLGELARKNRQAQRSKAQAAFDNTEGKSAAPAGYQALTFQYCENPRQCREASVVVPAKAEGLSDVNSQHVFRSEVDGEQLILYAGPADVNAPYRSLTDRDYIRMRDLANANGWSREKADSVSTQELTLDGKYALMTRFRYLRDRNVWWIGERVLVENRGTQFLVGCTAPEQHFADAEVICTTLVNSLRLP